MSILLNTKQFCIAVASHISNESRIPYLIECLTSLTTQTIPVEVYLSISCVNDEVKEKTLNSINNENKILNEYLNIRVREQKRHKCVIISCCIKKFIKSINGFYFVMMMTLIIKIEQTTLCKQHKPQN